MLLAAGDCRQRARSAAQNAGKNEISTVNGGRSRETDLFEGLRH